MVADDRKSELGPQVWSHLAFCMPSGMPPPFSRALVFSLENGQGPGNSRGMVCAD